jgi:hypothetical protein
VTIELDREPLVTTRDLNDRSVPDFQGLELINKLERSSTPIDPNRVMRLYQFPEVLWRNSCLVTLTL